MADQLEKNLKTLERKLDDLIAVSIGRRELNQLQVHMDDKLKKMHDKLTDTVNTLKNQLIKISALVNGNDDLNEVMAQIKMITEKRE